jgi:phosphatidylserine decarboxylase
MPISFWNRRLGKFEEESVYGDLFVRLAYSNPVSHTFTDAVLAGKAFSRMYGGLQSSRLSRLKVAGFVKKFQIPMEQYEPGPFLSFNDFFIRRFREGRRDFPVNPDRMGAPAEARYLAFADTSKPVVAPIKGLDLDPLELLGETPQREKFLGGPCLLARLCPVDYHRFHFPADGRVIHFHEEHGKLHSVNPLALRRDPRLLLENERHVSILDTADFGLLAYVEVGALCVGRIMQTHPIDRPFHRGDEKGYFLFGASTVVVLGQPGKWLPDQDLLEKTENGIECLVELGSPVAAKV